MIATQPRKKTGLLIWIGFTGALTLLGIAAWFVQLVQGVGATGLSNLEPWGSYIGWFIFFLGLSAGSLVLAALPVLFDLQRYYTFAKVSALAALVALIIAGLFITVDIGRPERLWRILLNGQVGSPMLWDVILTIVYFTISILYLWRLMISSKSNAMLKSLAWMALMAGLADAITGFVFATQVAREFWYSAVQPIAFFVAALGSAGAFSMLVVVLLRSRGYDLPAFEEFRPLMILTAVALGIDLLLIVSELITLAFTRSDDALVLVQAMIKSPLFWVEMVTAILAILFLLTAAARTPQGIVAASLLALVDLAVKRYLFVQMGFVEPNVKYPGAVTFTGAQAYYLPSFIEWGLIIGLIGLFALLFSMGLRILRLDSLRGSL